MIRLLNVYYPTRTVLLLLCETLVVGGCFLAATWIMHGSDASLVLQDEQGIYKIAAITLITIVLSY